jgi:hypothetical protein
MQLCKLLRKDADAKRKEDLNLNLYHKLISNEPIKVWPSWHAWKAHKLAEKLPNIELSLLNLIRCP